MHWLMVSKLTEQFCTLLFSYKANGLKAIENYMKDTGIWTEMLHNTEVFKNKIQKAEFKDRKKSINRRMWSQNEKEQHSKQMKEVWRQRMFKTRLRSCRWFIVPTISYYYRFLPSMSPPMYRIHLPVDIYWRQIYIGSTV